jgi:hypothetical protein
MTFKRVVCASTLAAGVGLAGLLGVGLGTASADPGPGCNAPGKPPCGQDQHYGNNGPGNNWNNGPGDNHGGGPADWHGRGIDQGRQDHQPFNWNGVQVNPIPAGNGAGWGFWFMGMWIPL